MNAAARQMSQSNFFSGQLGGIRLSTPMMVQLVLLVAVLFSALAVVYSTNVHRVTFTELQQAMQQENKLQLRWGQLLLEQASLATPARVQDLAASRLKMVLPANNQTVMIPLQ